MTLEEAIEHCKKEAENQRKKVPMYKHMGLDITASGCNECAAEHEQLAEWLIELKQRREAEISEKPKTNGDRIRQMTDEEFAEWFAPHMMCNICDKKSKPIGCNQNECKKYALAYMKKEVSEDD